MSSIIDNTTRGGDIDIVKAQFHPIVACEILKMVLGSNQHSNSWIWLEEIDGKFNVCSSYMLI